MPILTSLCILCGEHLTGEVGNITCGDCDRKAAEAKARAASYGAQETNGLENGLAYHAQRSAAIEATGEPEMQVYWTAPGLKVTRFRLISDRGFPFWDVSYCHGELNGVPVRVDLPFSQLRKFVPIPRSSYFFPTTPTKRIPSIAQQVIEFAKKDGVYAKGLGILDCISTLV